MTMQDDSGIVYDADGSPILDPNIRKAMRNTQEENERLRRENEILKLSGLFESAGVPRTPSGDYFRETYKGEATLEAVKAAAERAGVLSTNQTTVSKDENASQQKSEREQQLEAELENLRRANGVNGSMNSEAGDEVLTAQLERLKSAKNADEAKAILESPEFQALRNVPVSRF